MVIKYGFYVMAIISCRQNDKKKSKKKFEILISGYRKVVKYPATKRTFKSKLKK